MSPLLLALALVADTPGTPRDLDARMRASAAASQALQGELDGAWTLTDSNGHPLFALVITDRSGGQGPLEAAWRAPSGEIGPAALIDRRGSRLDLRLRPEGPRIVLRRRSARAWSGWIAEAGHRRGARLRPGP